MLSNFRNQLKEQNMEDKFEAVFAEIPVVREALGWIPLVTPTSQIVGMQAFLNVKFGRWKQISPQAADIALGYYGTTPAPVNKEVQALAAKQADKDPITCRPVDAPGSNHVHMQDLRKELKDKGMSDDDEHCVIHAMFPAQLETHIKNKNKPKDQAPAAAPVTPPAEPTVEPASFSSAPGKVTHLSLTISGKEHQVTVEELS